MAYGKHHGTAVFAAGILLLTISVSTWASSYTFRLTAEKTAILPGPLSLDLEGIAITETQTPRLYRLENDAKIALASQVEAGRTVRLWYMLDRTVKQNETVTLELVLDETARRPPAALAAVVDDTTITLRHNNTPILSYHHAVHPVPQGVDPVFGRSGFIHPLYTPDGLVVTRIQPPDHYHHYGIWSPWTKTRVEGREVDFWNLAQRQGTVRFAGLLSTVNGPVYTGFKARQEHVMFIGGNTEKNAINEVWDIRAAPVTLDGRTVWLVDYTSTLHNALDSSIELSAYRYGGGLGFRATDDWNRDNLRVLTSDGKTRNEADGTRARWADIRGSGRNKTGTAGVLFLSHIANREHPEPMRVWPDSSTGNGLMFFEFCPIRHNDWILEPNREYVLRYRMIIYDGMITPDTAEVLWKNFTQPPTPALVASKAS